MTLHGDAEGVRGLSSALVDWLTTLGLTSAGPQATVGRYIGYLRPYATSHVDLDLDDAVEAEVHNAAITLCRAVRVMREGRWPPGDAPLPEPRPK